MQLNPGLLSQDARFSPQQPKRNRRLREGDKKTLSITALKWAFKLRVTGPAKPVLLALANHYNDERRESWPALPLIQREAGVCRRTALYALSQLEKLDLIETQHTAGRVSRYILNVGRELPDRCKRCTTTRARDAPDRCKRCTRTVKNLYWNPY